LFYKGLIQDVASEQGWAFGLQEGRTAGGGASCGSNGARAAGRALIGVQPRPFAPRTCGSFFWHLIDGQAELLQ
jgi:hypothetical protein